MTLPLLPAQQSSKLFTNDLIIQQIINDLRALWIHSKRVSNDFADSTVQIITTPGGGGLPPSAPIGASYWVGQVASELLNELIPTGEEGVVSVDAGNALIGLENEGLLYSKFKSRVIAFDETRVIPHLHSVVEARYYLINGVLELQGDATLEVL